MDSNLRTFSGRGLQPRCFVHLHTFPWKWWGAVESNHALLQHGVTDRLWRPANDTPQKWYRNSPIRMYWYRAEESNLIRLAHNQECDHYTLPGMIRARRVIRLEQSSHIAPRRSCRSILGRASPPKRNFPRFLQNRRLAVNPACFQMLIMV